LADETKNNEGPACACGKADLYEEWLKQNEKKEDASIPTSQSDSQVGSSNVAGIGNREPVQIKKSNNEWIIYPFGNIQIIR
jgi:hypothetical protein